MASKTSARRSFWTWGLQSDEPTEAQRRHHAGTLSERFGVEIVPPPIPRAKDLGLRSPRVSPPSSISEFCFTDNYERARHAYSNSDIHPAVFGHFPNPPDLVAHPRNDKDLEAVLEWCSAKGHTAIPFWGRLILRRRCHATRGPGRRGHHRHGPL